MSNFYEYLHAFNKPRAIVEDAMPMREHPDGSPCYAKTAEACPILRQEKKADNADDIEEPKEMSTEARHLSELMDTLKQIKKWVPGSGDIKFSHLESAYEFLDEQMKAWQPGEDGVMSGTRQKRDEVFAKHPDAQYQSFDLETGNEIDSSTAAGKWGVTFHTTNAESKGDEEYDTNVAMFSSILQTKPQVGVYEGSCEISYNCPSLILAAATMVRCEQKAIFGNMIGKRRKRKFGVDVVNYSFDQKENNLERPVKPQKKENK